MVSFSIFFFSLYSMVFTKTGTYVLNYQSLLKLY